MSDQQQQAYAGTQGQYSTAQGSGRYDDGRYNPGTEAWEGGASQDQNGSDGQYTNPADRFAGGRSAAQNNGGQNQYSSQYTSGSAAQNGSSQYTAGSAAQSSGQNSYSGTQSQNNSQYSSQYTAGSGSPGSYGPSRQSTGRQEWQYFDGQPGSGKPFTYSVNGGDRDEVEIDLGEIFSVLLHWAWLIILVALACGTAGYCYSRFVLPEQFESTTKIYVLDKSDTGQSTYNDIQTGTQLTQDYVEIITSRAVLEKVMEDYNLLDTYTYDAFEDKVDVDTPDSTRIVSITVTDTDPAMAQQLADAVRVEAAELILTTMDIDAVNTFEEANYPTEKSAPINSRWAIIAALVGALLVIAVVVIRYLMDDTVKTSEDVEHYLNISTLALIPLDEALGDTDRKGRKKNKKDKGGGSESRGAAPAQAENSGKAIRHSSRQQGESPAPETVRRVSRQNNDSPAQESVRRSARSAGETGEQPRRRRSAASPQPTAEQPQQSASAGQKTGRINSDQPQSAGKNAENSRAQSDTGRLRAQGTGRMKQTQSVSAGQGTGRIRQPQPAVRPTQRTEALYSIDDLLGEDDFDLTDDYDMNEPDDGGEA